MPVQRQTHMPRHAGIPAWFFEFFVWSPSPFLSFVFFSRLWYLLVSPSPSPSPSSLCQSPVCFLFSSHSSLSSLLCFFFRLFPFLFLLIVFFRSASSLSLLLSRLSQFPFPSHPFHSTFVSSLFSLSLCPPPPPPSLSCPSLPLFVHEESLTYLLPALLTCSLTSFSKPSALSTPSFPKVSPTSHHLYVKSQLNQFPVKPNLP